MPIPLVYEFDDSAVSPDNLVTGELHSVNIGEASLIVLVHGLFYTEGIVIRNNATNALLVKGVDYVFRGFDPEMTALTGHEAASAIYFPTFTGVAKVRAQMVGGYQSMNSAIMKELSDALANLPPNDYNQLANTSLTMPPDSHSHSFVDDLTNLEAFRLIMIDLKNAIINRRSVLQSNRNLAEKVERLLYVIAGIRGSMADFINLDSKEDKSNKKNDLFDPGNINDIYYATTEAIINYINSLPFAEIDTFPYAPEMALVLSDNKKKIIKDGKKYEPKLNRLPFITSGSWNGDDVGLLRFDTVDNGNGIISNNGFDLITNTSGKSVTATSSKNLDNKSLFFPEITDVPAGKRTLVYSDFEDLEGTNAFDQNKVTGTALWNKVQSLVSGQQGQGADFLSNVTPVNRSLMYGKGALCWFGTRGRARFTTITGQLPDISSVIASDVFINFTVIQDYTVANTGVQGLIKLKKGSNSDEYLTVRYDDYADGTDRIFKFTTTVTDVAGFANIESSVPDTDIQVLDSLVDGNLLIQDHNDRHFRFQVKLKLELDGYDTVVSVIIHNDKTGFEQTVAVIRTTSTALNVVLSDLKIDLGYNFGSTVTAKDNVNDFYVDTYPRAMMDEFRISKSEEDCYPEAPMYLDPVSGTNTEFYNLFRFSLAKGINTELGVGKFLRAGFKCATSDATMYVQFDYNNSTTIDISFWHNFSGTLVQSGSTSTVVSNRINKDLGLYIDTYDASIGNNTQFKLVLAYNHISSGYLGSGTSALINNTNLTNNDFNQFFITTDQDDCTVSLFDNPATFVGSPFLTRFFADRDTIVGINQKFYHGRMLLGADSGKFNYIDLSAETTPYSKGGTGDTIKDIVDANVNDIDTLKYITDLKNTVVNDVFTNYNTGTAISESTHIVQRGNLLYSPYISYLPFYTSGRWNSFDLESTFKFKYYEHVSSLSNSVYEKKLYNDVEVPLEWNYPTAIRTVRTDFSLTREQIAPQRLAKFAGTTAPIPKILSYFNEIKNDLYFKDEVQNEDNFWSQNTFINDNKRAFIVPGKFDEGAVALNGKNYLYRAKTDTNNFPDFSTMGKWHLHKRIYVNSMSDTHGILSIKDANFTEGLNISLQSDSNFKVKINSVITTPTNYGIIPAGSWIDINLYYDGTNYKFDAYVGNTLIALDDWAGSNLSSNLNSIVLGASILNITNVYSPTSIIYLNGHIDEFYLADCTSYGVDFRYEKPLGCPRPLIIPTPGICPDIPGVRFSLCNSLGLSTDPIPNTGKYIEIGFLKRNYDYTPQIADTDGIILRIERMYDTLSNLYYKTQPHFGLNGVNDNSALGLNLTDVDVLRKDLFLWIDTSAYNDYKLVLSLVEVDGSLTELYRDNFPILAETTYFQNLMDTTSPFAFVFSTNDPNANIVTWKTGTAYPGVFVAPAIDTVVLPAQWLYNYKMMDLPFERDFYKFSPKGIKGNLSHMDNSDTTLASKDVDSAIKELSDRLDNVKVKRTNYVKVRQTVMSGKMDSQGRADFLDVTYEGSIPYDPDYITLDATAKPLFVTFGDGHDEEGERNYIVKLEDDMILSTVSNTDLIYLFLELNPITGTVTLSSSTAEPVYSLVRPTTADDDQFWYPIDHRTSGYVYNTGTSAWKKVLRVYIGMFKHLNYGAFTYGYFTFGESGFIYKRYFTRAVTGLDFTAEIAADIAYLNAQSTPTLVPGYEFSDNIYISTVTGERYLWNGSSYQNEAAFTYYFYDTDIVSFSFNGVDIGQTPWISTYGNINEYTILDRLGLGGNSKLKTVDLSWQIEMRVGNTYNGNPAPGNMYEGKIYDLCNSEQDYSSGGSAEGGISVFKDTNSILVKIDYQASALSNRFDGVNRTQGPILYEIKRSF